MLFKTQPYVYANLSHTKEQELKTTRDLKQRASVTKRAR